jgi:GNAT superfamily N-acetyltransferase
MTPAKPEAKIALAGPQYEHEIFKLCRLMHAEQPYHPLNMNKVATMVRLATQPNEQRRGIVGVIGEPDHVRAAIFLMIDPIWYSDDWQLLEFFNYVRPEYRKTPYATAMLKYAKSCADTLGIDLTIGVFSNIRTEGKCRLYRRQVPKLGEIFCYAPPNRKAFYKRLEEASPIAAE